MVPARGWWRGLARPAGGGALLVMALAALAGCQRSAAGDAGPTRRPGLWRQAITRDGKPAPMGVLTLCVDAATDRRMGVFGHHLARADCDRSVERDAAGVYHFVATCRLSDGAVVKSMGTASGDFGSGYTVHSEVNVTDAPMPPLNGMHVIDVSGRYEGPCPAGMKPGDVSLGSGVKVNLDSLPQIAALFGG